MVHVFESQKKLGTFGMTNDPAGTNLPVALAPWKKAKPLDLKPTDAPRVALDSQEALAAIEKDGFFITTPSVTSTIRVGK